MLWHSILSAISPSVLIIRRFRFSGGGSAEPDQQLHLGCGNCVATMWWKGVGVELYFCFYLFIISQADSRLKLFKRTEIFFAQPDES